MYLPVDYCARPVSVYEGVLIRWEPRTSESTVKLSPRFARSLNNQVTIYMQSCKFSKLTYIILVKYLSKLVKRLRLSNFQKKRGSKHPLYLNR